MNYTEYITATPGSDCHAKPLPLTSPWADDAVAMTERAAWRGLGEPKGGPIKVKCGHAGTLDPLATGVMLVCVGKATKAVDRLMGLTKVYEADIDLSAFTATDDREGAREAVSVMAPPTPAEITRACAAMVGESVSQMPPRFSAIHVGGRRAYDLAREGAKVTLGPRLVRIDAIDVLAYAWPTLRLRVTCGKGTYIRSIARELGQALTTGGHLTSLRRTAVGPYRVEQAVGLDTFEKPFTADAAFVAREF